MATTGALAQNVIDESCVANADLSAKQFFFVKIVGTANGRAKVDLCGAGDAVYGVLQDKQGNASGRPCTVRKAGATKLVAGGTITAGTHLRLKADAAGKAVATAAAGDEYGAEPITSAASGDTFSAYVIRGQRGA